MTEVDRQPVTRSLANQYEEKRQRANRKAGRLRSAEKLACLDALRGRCHLLTAVKAQADLAALGFDRHQHTVKTYAQELGEVFAEDEKVVADRQTVEAEAIRLGRRLNQLWRRRQ